MFFQVSPPIRQKSEKPIKKVEKSDDVGILTLAPFTAIPKICFDNVKVGQSSSQNLVIKNPRPYPVEITVQVTTAEEVPLFLSWSARDVEANSENNLIITWTPTSVGTWRSILHVNDGGRLSRDVPIALKSISSSKKNNNKGTQGRKNNLPRYVTRKTSPILSRCRKKSPQKRLLLPNVIDNLPLVKISSPEIAFGGKENVSNFSPTFIQDHRRETYIVGRNLPEPQIFDDSLENNSPTVSFEKRLQSESFVLSSVLTPKNNEFCPVDCSTDEKSLTINATFTGPKKFLFPDEDTTLETENKDNYEVANASGETFILNNLSSETYVKNTSSLTYSKDLSDYDLNICSTPPNYSQQTRLNSLTGTGVKDTIEADLWSNSMHVPKRNLTAIQEESLAFELKSTPIKRKSDLTMTIIPSKRPNMRDSYINDWSKIKSASYVDPQTAAWLEQQEDKFKRWLNAVLIPPNDLKASEQAPVDIAKLWKMCQQRQPQQQLNSPMTNVKLNPLRKSARILYKSADVQMVLSKVWTAVDSGRLSIRADRAVHLDLGLQADMMSVFLSYNPLWLRLGLETIYGVIVPLKHNSDVLGLSSFLLERFIRDPQLLRRFKSVHTNKYAVEIKKCILKKFLALIYFLDRAKKNKLVPHDPCLFCKNAPIKESREALLRFSRDILSSMGDVTKYLSNFKYVVEYKQSYLDEFDYTVNCLGTDLRDGVRLTRVMEIILLQNDLSKNLRVPAISRLQKVHNVTLVFQVINKQNFEIKYEITPKDIVDGHKEKTLSFLWQIIYNFNTPLMAKSVTTITMWWRSDAVVAKRRELRVIREKREEAARKIQIWYKKKTFWHEKKLEKLKNRAAVKIQSLAKMFLARRRFQAQRDAAIIIQRKWRATLIARLRRNYFLCLRHYVIVIQQKWRAMLAMRKEMEKFQILKATTIMIQMRFRANVMMKTERIKFQVLKYSVIIIQRKFRAKLLARKEFDRFQQLKIVTIFVQRKRRAILVMRKQKENYQYLKNSAIVLQRKFRANRVARMEADKFKKLRMTTVFIQNMWRAKISMRTQRNNYQHLKRAVVLIQVKWRATIAMKKEMEHYQNLKNSVIVLQRKFRANRIAKIEAEKFEKLKLATTFVQNIWRAKISMRIERTNYQNLKRAAVFIQNKWHAKIAMKREMSYYKSLKKATVVIQRLFRAKMERKIELENFQRLKKITIFVQNTWREKMLMRKVRQDYQDLKRAVISVQRKWRAKLARRRDMENYQSLRNSTIIIQRRYRANLQTKLDAGKYRTLRKAAVVIQRKWRATLLMRVEMKNYEDLKKQRRRVTVLAIEIQKYARGFLIRRKYAYFWTAETMEERRILRIQAKAAVKIQAFWKAYKIRSARSCMMKEISERLKIANRTAKPENTLGARCKKAVIQLSKVNTSLREILRVLEDLEFITRWDRQSCLKLGAVLPEHLYKTVISTNRSPPEIQVCTAAVNILINFHRYKPTRSKSWMPEYIENLITVMLHYCDNETPLFPTLCTLIWLFLQNDEYKTVIIASHRCKEKMLQIKTKCERKAKMVNKVNVKYHSYFVQNTRHLPLPSTVPDWGLEYKDKPKVFSNSVFAFNCVWSALNF